MIAPIEAAVGQCRTDEMTYELVRPSIIPIVPPSRQITTASVRNWRRMSPGSAPTAIRRPISRVRSVTETSMMFMMPTPPTTREIIATHKSSFVIISVVELIALVISVMSRTLKSLGLAALRWCRSRSNMVICWMAEGMLVLDRAAVRIWSTLANRIGCGVLACSLADGIGYREAETATYGLFDDEIVAALSL